MSGLRAEAGRAHAATAATAAGSPRPKHPPAHLSSNERGNAMTCTRTDGQRDQRPARSPCGALPKGLHAHATGDPRACPCPTLSPLSSFIPPPLGSPAGWTPSPAGRGGPPPPWPQAGRAPPGRKRCTLRALRCRARRPVRPRTSAREQRRRGCRAHTQRLDGGPDQAHGRIRVGGGQGAVVPLLPSNPCPNPPAQLTWHR